MPPPNFKSFNKALGKNILSSLWTENSFTFPLDGNLRFRVTEKLFSQSGMSDN